MTVNIINAVGIVLGTLVGLLFKGRLSQRYEKAIYAAAGMSALVVGILMVSKTPRILHMSLALSIGAVLGTFGRIEDRIHHLGHKLHGMLGQRADTPASDFADGFLAATVLFCVGPMAIMGSIQAGTGGSWSILLTKTVMDSFIAILFAAAKGPGVGLSAISVLLYQGLITLGAGSIAPLMSPLMEASISGTGGAMVLMIGLNLLGLTKIPTGNFLPALFLVVLLAWIDPSLPVWLQL